MEFYEYFGFLGLIIVNFADFQSNRKLFRILKIIALVFYLTQAVLLNVNSLILSSSIGLVINVYKSVKENLS